MFPINQNPIAVASAKQQYFSVLRSNLTASGQKAQVMFVPASLHVFVFVSLGTKCSSVVLETQRIISFWK